MPLSRDEVRSLKNTVWIPCGQCMNVCSSFLRSRTRHHYKTGLFTERISGISRKWWLSLVFPRPGDSISRISNKAFREDPFPGKKETLPPSRRAGGVRDAFFPQIILSLRPPRRPGGGQVERQFSSKRRLSHFRGTLEVREMFFFPRIVSLTPPGCPRGVRDAIVSTKKSLTPPGRPGV